MFESDIIKELKLEEKYTGKQLISFIKNNKDNVVLSEDTNQFTSHSEREFEVIEIFEMYNHQNIDWNYRIPNKKKKIIIVK